MPPNQQGPGEAPPLAGAEAQEPSPTAAPVNKLGDAFSHAEDLDSATEISFRCRMTKACFMKGLDKVAHHSIRIFEHDNQFFLREPLDKMLGSESSGPCQPAYISSACAEDGAAEEAEGQGTPGALEAISPTAAQVLERSHGQQRGARAVLCMAPDGTSAFSEGAAAPPPSASQGQGCEGRRSPCAHRARRGVGRDRSCSTSPASRRRGAGDAACAPGQQPLAEHSGGHRPQTDHSTGADCFSHPVEDVRTRLKEFASWRRRA